MNEEPRRKQKGYDQRAHRQRRASRRLDERSLEHRLQRSRIGEHHGFLTEHRGGDDDGRSRVQHRGDQNHGQNPKRYVGPHQQIASEQNHVAHRHDQHDAVEPRGRQGGDTAGDQHREDHRRDVVLCFLERSRVAAHRDHNGRHQHREGNQAEQNKQQCAHRNRAAGLGHDLIEPAGVHGGGHAREVQRGAHDGHRRNDQELADHQVDHRNGTNHQRFECTAFSLTGGQIDGGVYGAGDGHENQDER